MFETDLTAAEKGIVRWFRSLDQRTINAIHLWLLFGDTTMIVYEFTRRPLKAA